MSWKHIGVLKPIKKWDTKRLDKRFCLFENICLPSLINQVDKTNLHIIIIISKDLPIEYQSKLIKLVREYEYIHVMYYDGTLSNTYIKRYIDNNTEIIATIRLDDDDGISPDFVKLLSKYCKTKYINNVVSFSEGIILQIKKNKLTYRTHSSSLIASGLCLIQDINSNNNIYTDTRHRRLHKIYNVITDKQQYMYVVSNHIYGDEERVKFSYINNPLTDTIIKKYNYIKFKNLEKIDI